MGEARFCKRARTLQAAVTLDLGFLGSTFEVISMVALAEGFSTVTRWVLPDFSGSLTRRTRVCSAPQVTRPAATLTLVFFGKPAMAALALPSKAVTFSSVGRSWPAR